MKLMKYIIGALAAAAMLVSCGKDDGNTDDGYAKVQIGFIQRQGPLQYFMTIPESESNNWTAHLSIDALEEVEYTGEKTGRHASHQPKAGTYVLGMDKDKACFWGAINPIGGEMYALTEGKLDISYPSAGKIVITLDIKAHTPGNPSDVINIKAKYDGVNRIEQ